MTHRESFSTSLALVALATVASFCLSTFPSGARAAGGGGEGRGLGGGTLLVRYDAYEPESVLDNYKRQLNDFDNDGWQDNTDNCRFRANADQADSDGDGVGDACDNCPKIKNADQFDTDGDARGDVCDDDNDGDKIPDNQDNCPAIENPSQRDTDGDGQGDACDEDDDNDGVRDRDDNCPLVANPTQDDATPNQHGAACDADTDGDEIEDSKDNCPTVPNKLQLDADKDGLGDGCDPDKDNDGVMNKADNCDVLPNAAQVDADRDGKGDLCDPQYCYVVAGDEKNCLDPTSPFAMYSPGITIRTGEPTRLSMFANRINAEIRYQWVVTKRPQSSSAEVENPHGATARSRLYDYLYLKSSVPTFTADEPGDYQLKVKGELAFPDTVNPTWERTHSYVMTLTAEGPSMSDGGCALGRGPSARPLPWLLLLALFVLRQRRR
jgi:hypothetical protein